MNTLNTLFLTFDPGVIAAADPGVLRGDSGIAGVLKGLLKSIAIILVLAGVFNAVKNVLAGKAANAAKTMIGVLIIAAILWDPTILGTLLTALQTGLKSIFTGIESIWS